MAALFLLAAPAALIRINHCSVDEMGIGNSLGKILGKNGLGFECRQGVVRSSTIKPGVTKCKHG